MGLLLEAGLLPILLPEVAALDGVPQPVRFHPECDVLTHTLMLLDAFEGGEKVAFEEGETRLHPGDRLFMYTDGITEHCGASDEAFGEERFVEQLCIHKDQSLDNVTRDVLIAMREFGGSTLPIDDVTLIGIEFT